MPNSKIPRRVLASVTLLSAMLAATAGLAQEVSVSLVVGDAVAAYDDGRRFAVLSANSTIPMHLSPIETGLWSVRIEAADFNAAAISVGRVPLKLRLVGDATGTLLRYDGYAVIQLQTPLVAYRDPKQPGIALPVMFTSGRTSQAGQAPSKDTANGWLDLTTGGVELLGSGVIPRSEGADLAGVIAIGIQAKLHGALETLRR